MRRLLLAAAFASPIGCGQDEPDCSGLACLSGSGTAAMSTSATSSAATDDGSEASGSSDASASTTLTSTTSTTASTTDPDSGDATTDATETSTDDGEDVTTGPPPCRGANCPELAECFGLGVWGSCAQYCEAGKAECVEAGCDGATVVYYGDVDDCVAMSSGGGANQSCDAPFQQGGGASFGRCCCE